MVLKKDLDAIEDIDNETVKNTTRGETLADKKPSKAGRKKKAAAEKAANMMAVYFTDEQKEAVQNYCDKIGIPFSNLVKQLLVDKGVI
ncbi:MAG: hypothetical protein H6Q72_3678 [Firmicutes bacterium]|nr:hypothetical protein [Bacillota bacterium]